MRVSAVLLFSLLGTGAFVSACSDSRTVTSPAAPGTGATRLVLSAPTTVNVVRRNEPLATAQSASAIIGIFGGSITLPGAGLTVVVPAFAVSAPTNITVTAVAGSQVAYEFEPHGIQFTVPLIATQDLSGTSAAANGTLLTTLHAGYFANVLDLNQANGTAVVSELLGTSVSTLTRTVTFSIHHFSGYLIATGEAPPAGEGSQQ